MSLTPLEQHVLAYYLAGSAGELDMAGRFYPYSELVFVIADKIEVAVRKFGRKARAATKPAATALLDEMIAKGAFSTKQNDFGGTMHQFQAPAYRQALGELREADPIVRDAAAGGEGFWADRFAALTA